MIGFIFPTNVKVKTTLAINNAVVLTAELHTLLRPTTE